MEIRFVKNKVQGEDGESFWILIYNLFDRGFYSNCVDKVLRNSFQLI